VAIIDKQTNNRATTAGDHFHTKGEGKVVQHGVKSVTVVAFRAITRGVAGKSPERDHLKATYTEWIVVE
jgi:hypothetical protein